MHQLITDPVVTAGNQACWAAEIKATKTSPAHSLLSLHHLHQGVNSAETFFCKKVWALVSVSTSHIAQTAELPHFFISHSACGQTSLSWQHSPHNPRWGLWTSEEPKFVGAGEQAMQLQHQEYDWWQCRMLVPQEVTWSDQPVFTPELLARHYLKLLLFFDVPPSENIVENNFYPVSNYFSFLLA